MTLDFIFNASSTCIILIYIFFPHHFEGWDSPIGRLWSLSQPRPEFRIIAGAIGTIHRWRVGCPLFVRYIYMVLAFFGVLLRDD